MNELRYQYLMRPSMWTNMSTQGPMWTGLFGMRTLAAGKYSRTSLFGSSAKTTAQFGFGGRMVQGAILNPIGAGSRYIGKIATAHGMGWGKSLNKYGHMVSQGRGLFAVSDKFIEGRVGAMSARERIAAGFAGFRGQALGGQIGGRQLMAEISKLKSIGSTKEAEKVIGTLFSNRERYNEFLTELSGKSGVSRSTIVKRLKDVAPGISQTTRTEMAGLLSGTLKGKAKSDKIASAALRKTLKSRMAWLAPVGATAVTLGNAALAVSILAPLAEFGVRAVMSPLNESYLKLRDTLNRAVNTEFGGSLSPGFMTGQASTERQRAIQEIHRSRINARSSIGQEGSLMHQ